MKVSNLQEQRHREDSEVKDIIILQLRIITSLATRLNELSDAFSLKQMRSESERLRNELELLDQLLESYQMRINK